VVLLPWKKARFHPYVEVKEGHVRTASEWRREERPPQPPQPPPTGKFSTEAVLNCFLSCYGFSFRINFCSANLGQLTCVTTSRVGGFLVASPEEERNTSFAGYETKRAIKTSGVRSASNI